MNTEQLLKLILKNQAIIYGKLLSIEKRMKGTTGVDNYVNDAIRDLKKYQADVDRLNAPNQE